MDAFNDLNIYPQLSGFIDDKCGWVLTDMQDKASISSNCAVFKTIDGGKKWEKLSLPSSTIPKSVMRDGSIHFIDKMNGWVIRFYDSETGYASELLKTSNGGATWEISTLNSQHGVGKFKFFNKNIGIVLPQSTTHIPSVFRTINGGKSFEQITKGVDYNFTALHFIDEKTGFAGGREAIIKTTDGGVSWEKCKEAKGVEINFIKFYDSKKGIVLGNNETTGISVFHTDDGGKSWIRVSSVDDLLQFTKNEDIPPIAIKVVLKSDYSPIKSVFPKENLCFSILGDGSVLRSENDSGKYFEDVSTFGFDTYLSDIVFLNEKTGWVSGSTFLNDSTPIQINYFIKKTTDAGETWTEYSSSQKISNFQHLSFVDSLYGWCYSDLNDSLRCVWNTTDGGKTWSPNIVNAPNSLANFLGFQDRLNGWIVLSDPTPYMPWYIYRTKDGGKTWQPFTHTFSIFQLFFVNNNTFYGGGDINLIKATGID
ncbi:MAG: hypothetical protein IPJ75_11495 [Ignavibacteriales bacterium]|nr:hypothetical protein [Ignavibacteriales bacterium]